MRDEQDARTQIEALDRLVAITKSDTGQSARVANFLLAWWNAGDNGGFDFTDLWNVDEAIANDMLLVAGLITGCRSYPDAFGYEEDFRQMVMDWRKPKRRRRA
jgi:hypothetical protein